MTRIHPEHDERRMPVILDPAPSLPGRLLEWVSASVSPDAEVLSVQRLYGGTSSLVHSILLRVGREQKQLVLRQFNNEEWLRQEPDLALHEAESLRLASRTGLPTPKLVAFDETGRDCGVPAVLMTRLDGSVVLQPDNMEEWLDRLAAALARIHNLEAESFRWKYYNYQDLDALEPPAWTDLPDVWDIAVSVAKGPRPKTRECFIHRDYHPTNVLWKDGGVSGIVDWVNACRGPAGIDVGHCRVNLAQLYGVAAADRFLSLYLKHAGSQFRYDPYWDLISLVDILFGPPEVYPGWTALGVSGLTERLIMERLDAYAASLVARVRRGETGADDSDNRRPAGIVPRHKTGNSSRHRPMR